MSDDKSTAGSPATVPGGYHSGGVPGEEGVMRRQMRVLKVADPSKRVARGRPLKGGQGPAAAAGARADAADAAGVAAGPAGTLFVVTARALDVLDSPVFHAGDGDEEAVAVFTTANAARRYIERAGWAEADEVGVLRPGDLEEWLRTAPTAASDGSRSTRIATGTWPASRSRWPPSKAT